MSLCQRAERTRRGDSGRFRPPYAARAFRTPRFALEHDLSAGQVTGCDSVVVPSGPLSGWCWCWCSLLVIGERMTALAGVFRVMRSGGGTGAGPTRVCWPDQMPVQLVGRDRHSRAARGLPPQTKPCRSPNACLGWRFSHRCSRINWTMAWVSIRTATGTRSRSWNSPRSQ
jgi:hypothetical protein